MIKKNGGIFGRNPTYNDVVVEGVLTLKEAQVFDNDITINGDLVVNGTETVINTVELNVDDKNITMGAVVAKVGLTSTSNITLGQFTVLIADTAGLVPGMTVTKTAGTGAFAAGAKIASVDSHYQITLDLAHTATGSITFDTGGATDFTADGGGITLKGTTDKFIKWVKAKVAWVFSDPIEVPDATVTGLTASKPVFTDANKKLTSSGTLAIDQGGTGSTTAANARTALGLGTMATQAANNVAITGGSVSGLTSAAVDNITIDGNTISSTNANGDINLTPNGTGNVATTAPIVSNKPTVAHDIFMDDVSANTKFGDVIRFHSNSLPNSRITRISPLRGQYADGIGWRFTVQAGSSVERTALDIQDSGMMRPYYSINPIDVSEAIFQQWTADPGVNADYGYVFRANYSVSAVYKAGLKAYRGDYANWMGWKLSTVYGTEQEAIDVKAGGDVKISAGNLIIGTSGKGIDFSATADGTTMTSELLSDYEEGTWTPDLINNGTITFTARYGRYTKIGRQVHLYWFIQVNTVSGGTGVATMTVPFAAAAPATGIFSYVGTNGVNTTGQPGCNSPGFYASNTSVYFYDISGGILYGVNVTAGSLLVGSMTYFV